jgi:glycogen synthase
MKILAVSRAYLPNLGGLETAAAALTAAWATAGHEVTIVTQTPGAGPPDGVTVERRPEPARLLALTRWADLVWHNHISLRWAWPLLIAPRPWVVTHQGWLRRADGGLGWPGRIKRMALRGAHSVAISRAIAADLPVASTIIPNPYRDRLFRLLPDGPRTFDLAFLGRFVSDKGAHLLLQALAELRPRGLRPRLLMIGSGPEHLRLVADAERLGLSDQVVFTGPQSGEMLVRSLNQAAILVVPSLFPEPFGIVALEGIACGCVVVGSAGGGLPEAIGPCGLTFANGDTAGLADRLAELLTDPQRRLALAAAAERHLAAFRAERVGQAYLDLFASVLAGGRGS